MADIVITIWPERASPGGQHVGTSPNGVRIEHIPTGTVAICQQHRSQHKNKQTAMAMIEWALSDLGWPQ